jgi:hypothetical protein
MDADPDEQKPVDTNNLSTAALLAHRELQQAFDDLKPEAHNVGRESN